jgi:hypothetical protein
MSTVARHLLAVAAGVVLIVTLAFLIDLAGFWLFPLAPGIQLGVTPVAEVIASRPAGAAVFILVMRLFAIVLGAYVAARLAPGHPLRDGMLATVLCLAIAVALGPPLARVLAMVVLFPIAGLVGCRLANRPARTEMVPA